MPQFDSGHENVVQFYIAFEDDSYVCIDYSNKVSPEHLSISIFPSSFLTVFSQIFLCSLDMRPTSLIIQLMCFSFQFRQLHLFVICFTCKCAHFFIRDCFPNFSF